MPTSITGRGIYAFPERDDALSASSNNPVQNRVLAEEISQLENAVNGKMDEIVNTASGAIAGFSDGGDNLPVKSLVAEIEPVQDLHGYDHPWPAGGGVNKFDNRSLHTAFDTNIGSLENLNAAITAGQMLFRGVAWTSSNVGDPISSFTSSNQYWVIFPLTVGTSYTTYKFAKNTIIVDSEFSVVRVLSNNTVSGETIKDGYSYVSFTAESDEAYMAMYVFNIAQGTSVQNWTLDDVINEYMVVNGSTRPSSYAPYSNICPITGWTGMSGKHTGKNLFNPSWSAFQTNWGEPYAFQPIPDISGEDITISLVDKGNGADISGVYFGVSVNGYNASGGVTWLINNGTVTGQTYTTNNKKFVSFYQANETVFNKIMARFDVQVERGSTATTYEAYDGESISVNWQTEAGVVYGGTVTLNEDGSADLVSTSGVLVVNGNDVSIARSYTNVMYASFYKSAESALSGIDNTNKICLCSIGEIYRPAGGFDKASNINKLAVSAEGSRYWYGFPLETSLETMQETLNGVVICHQLKEAYQHTYHFDNVGALNTFLGQNHIWTDTGDTTVTYTADTKLYIDQAIASAVAAI